MNFEYMFTTQASASIDIEDLGNFIIQAYSDIGQSSILIVKTILGNTQIIEYGPFYIDDNKMNQHIETIYDNISFDIKKIINKVTKFLDSKKIRVTQVVEKTFDEVKDSIKNPLDFLSLNGENK